MDSASREQWKSWVKGALALDVPYFARPDGELVSRAKVLQTRGKQAAVLAVLGFSGAEADPSLLLIRRSDSAPTHRGQMAFPGGAMDADDEEEGTPSPERTALRETREELGLDPSWVQTLGRLPPLFTFSSDFWVTPVVGLLTPQLGDVPLVPNPHEVDLGLWVPLSAFQAPGIYRQEFVEFGGRSYPTHVYQVDGHRIWGATAAMIHNLLERLLITQRS